MDIENAQNVLEKAREFIERHRPDASSQKKAAFANAVQQLVCGVAGGYGGPSVREHAAAYLFGGQKLINYGTAIEMLNKENGPIFGPINQVHIQCFENEECFDDDPHDLQTLAEIYNQ
tara:strand:+ start:41 stop:394 length:354 start_codon:yes stop_codon:yes gene_type:complete